MEIRKSIRGYLGSSYVRSDEFRSVHINEAFRYNGKVEYEVVIEYRKKYDGSGNYINREVFGKYPSERKALRIANQILKYLGKEDDKCS